MSLLAISRLVVLLMSFIYLPVSCQQTPLVLDIIPHQSPNEHARLARRAQPITAETYNNKTYYYVQASVGQPKQNVRMLVATNSADLILVSSSNPACKTGLCTQSGGTYNANASSTYKYQNQNFSIKYEDDSGTAGDVVTDTFTLGGQSFPNTTLLIGYTGNLTDSVLGIGYTQLEVTKTQYPNLPVQMYNQKLVNIVGYSLFFNHTNAASGGRLIFGGVDTGKFYNTLETLSISPADIQTYRRTTVQMSSITLFDGTANRTARDSSMSVVLESGNSVLTLPTAVFQNLGRLFNATLEDGFYIYRRGTVNANTTVNLQFGSTWISIPLTDMQFVSNSTHIALALSDAGLGASFIGLPYFKNAYTVFDYSHNQVSLAPLKHNAVADNVTLISANGVVGLTGFVEPTSGVEPAPPTTDPGTTDTDGGLSTGAKAGIGVGAAIGALLLIAAIVFLILRRRKNKNKQTPAPAPPMAAPSTVHHLQQQQQQQKLPLAMETSLDKPVLYQKEQYKPLHERESYGVMSELSAEHDNKHYSGYGYDRDQTLSPPLSEMYAPSTSPPPGSTATEIRRKPLPPQEMP